MKQLLFVLFIFLMSCNNKTDDKSNTNDEMSKATPTANNTNTASTWNKEDENEFMLGCVENSKGRMSEEAAFTYCKCVMGKVQQKFPSMDSAATVLTDTTKAAEFSKGCK